MARSHTNSQRWPRHVKGPGSRGSRLLQIPSRSSGLLPLLLPTQPKKQSRQEGLKARVLARLASLWDWTPGTPATYLVPGATPTEARTRPPNLRLHQPLLRKGGVQACLPQSLQLPLLVSATIALGASAPLHPPVLCAPRASACKPGFPPRPSQTTCCLPLVPRDSRDSCASMQLQLSEAKIFSEPVKMFHALWLKASPCLSLPREQTLGRT